MTELIKIETKNGKQTVSARELHEKLGVSTQFKDWIKRMVDYGFEEGKDYCSFLSESTGGRPAMEYFISIDMAKEICMIQRSEIGRKFRQYFIECERKLTEELEYNNTRSRSKKIRNVFTDTLKNHRYTKPHKYINTTKSMKKELGITAKKDDMTLQELAAVSASE